MIFLKLYYDKRLKDPTYYVQQGIRNGNKTTTKNVKRIGKHSELLKITDNPLEYAKEEIKKMNEAYGKGTLSLNYSINFNEKVTDTENTISASTYQNIGYFYLKKIYNQLALPQFFNEVAKNKKITFDCNAINEFLTYSRILSPQSKAGTFDKLETYYKPADFSLHHIFRFMDILAENYDNYIEHLYHKSNHVVPRNSKIMYYDCSNYYFEINQADDVYTDEVTGETIYGLRQFGFSKQHQPRPLVSMGLIMDSNGIPVTMCIYPGNANEQTTAIPMEKQLQKIINHDQFIYCADAGLASYHIRQFNSMGGKRFIVTQSIKKLSAALQDAVFNDFDYRLTSNNQSVSIEQMKTFNKNDAQNQSLYNDYAYKVVPANQLMDLGLYEEYFDASGRKRNRKVKGTLKQNLIITFSRKMMEYQREIRRRQIERAEKIIATKDPEKIKKGPNDVRRFIKSKNNEKISYELDKERIAEEEKYDGFYAIATNVKGEAAEIIKVVRDRYKIEECFRVMKTNFEARPIYHRKDNRITAHFLLCYTALLVYRLMENKLNNEATHVSPKNLIETLKNMSIANVGDLYYTALYSGSLTLQALESVFQLNIDRKNYKPNDINKILKEL